MAEYITTPITNVLQFDTATYDKYLAWLRHINDMQRAQSGPMTSIQYTKHVLGRQATCITLEGIRLWKWIGTFTAEMPYSKTKVEQLHWVLYASKRGMTFEIEVRFGPNDSLSAITMAKAGLEAAMALWYARERDLNITE